jgi:hypothetical protein
MKLPLPARAIVTLAVLLASAAAPGCSSTNVTVIQGDGEADSAITFPVADAEADDAAAPDAKTGDGASIVGATNPYGASYPTAHIGWRVRTGTVKGDVIANLTLAGYAAGASAVTTGSLADVFDPEGRTHDMVAAIVVSRWDAYSNMMMTSLAAALPARVALFAVLAEGNTAGTAATAADLTAWHTKYPSIASYLDPSASQWMPLLDVAAFPFVIELDARTMEIVSAGAGAPSNPKSDFEAAAAVIQARQPSY